MSEVFQSPRAKEEMRKKYRYAIFEEMAKLADGGLADENLGHFAETARFGVAQDYFTLEEMDQIIDVLLGGLIVHLATESRDA